MNRRNFFRDMVGMAIGVFGFGLSSVAGESKRISDDKTEEGVLYGMCVNVRTCIGCNRCAEACRTENVVPKGRFRTWVERYFIKSNDEVMVSQVGSQQDQVMLAERETDVLRSFFVPKLCNQCENPPCVQVCPVGATYKTSDGVVLVDNQRCIGCSYCVQACPYSVRFIHPERHTADKCTFCFHRISRGLLPACVEVCPTQTRVFGNLHSTASPLTRFKRMNNTAVLKPYLNTKPKVYYADLDGEVR